MKILIVDDSTGIRAIMNDMLSNAGYADILQADSAKSVFEKLGISNKSGPATPVDLIMMDIVMPDMDGIEACRRIKEDKFFKDVPVIMVSARTDDENLKLAFEAGAIDYIRKPINEVELLTRVRSALALKKETDGRKEKEAELLKALEELHDTNETLMSFKKAVENMQIGLTITDKKGKILYSNPAEAAMHGYSQEELVGRDVRLLAPKDHWKPMSSEKLRKIGSLKRESVNVKRDGTIFPVQLLSDVVRAQGGEPIAIVSTSEDITERKKAEGELREAREELEMRVDERTKELVEANRLLKEEMAERKTLQAEAMRADHLASLGELSAGIAHEINNPINGIINCAQILLNRCNNPGHEKEREVAVMIISEGKRISNIVKALLSFARERGEEKGAVRIHDVINDSLMLTEAHMHKGGIELSVDVPVELPVIRGHHQQIQQVFLNLINNARYALNEKHATNHEDKSLKISAQKITVDKKAFVRTTFEDNGTGIPGDIRYKIMDPFFSTKPDNKGTGLGLSISHGIVTDHMGKLLVESVEGEYTKIMIDLPVFEK